ncbi:MAG: IS6 family transposase [Nitrosotalea sp.]
MTETRQNQIEAREMKALTIVGQNNQIQRINHVTYKVKSQSSDFLYDVVHVYKQGWTCSCPDHIFRKVECKHIKSVLISNNLRKQIVPKSREELIQLSQELTCKCGSTEVIKDGIRKNKSGMIQRFECKSCGYRWSDNLGFEYSKVNPKAITVSLDLYFKGVSLRKIREHLKLFYGMTVSPSTVLGWIRKFEKVVTPFVDSFTPKELSGVYHVDEMMVHVRKEENGKGHYQWLWNMMDNTTRFWISSKVSQRREIEDARAVFQDAKRKTPTPIAIVHDGLQSYNDAYNSEYYTKKGKQVKNIRSVSVRHKGLNQKVERLNGIFRDREKVMRGMDHKESAQKTIDAFRIHYNFIREHSSIKKTPAEQAGIKLDLGNNKIENLIRLASKNV